ncbi:hypothetical protein [Vallicoccus soli]|uniref:Sulfotransferase family protein n=1 Tax=Vallicoccus soli TaxID=2339232 RepID=A0A3A3YYK9_9ACTN|nr:hypothetical protein [Vallicoccus soli]RJK95384.1 hypothetical protein D5H78_12045 [Vallicoccus soli]
MRDVVVLGCGRSGTSLVTGLVASAGRATGPRLLAPDPANPRGFFEDPAVNALNERLLAPLTERLGTGGGTYARPLREGERWLAALPADAEVGHLDVDRARALVPPGPWCLKDPRFSYTLRAWEPVLGDALRVLVVRHPGEAARSMVDHAANGTLGLGLPGALRVWEAVNRYVLEHHLGRGDWLVLHHAAVLDGSALPALEEALGAAVDRSFVDGALHRSPAAPVPPSCAALHAELLAAARDEGSAA